MRILALDLGTRTGWALRESGKHVLSDVQHFAWPAEMSLGRRLLSWSRWLMQGFQFDNIDAVVYELPHHRGGSSTRLLLGLVSVLELKMAGLTIDCFGVHTATLKKHATGKGNTKGKAAMIARANEIAQLDRQITDDNEADAVCLLDYAFSLEAIPRTT